MTEQIDINEAFPGGNIIVDKIIGDSIHLQQDLRDTNGFWFYWAFEISGAANRQLTFHFTNGDVLGARGAAISFDGGQSWRWLGEETVVRQEDSVSFAYHFPKSSSKVLLAFCPLYTQKTLDIFLSQQESTKIHNTVLCQSKARRDVEMLRLGNPHARTRIGLTCRHHACETMASYCLEGILQAIITDDEVGNWLRQNVDFAVVPFMDKDGVENGDQGKNRQPYDHNRDYAGSSQDSIYSEVKAWRQWAVDWFSAVQKPMLLDLHCPYIRGGNNEEVFFVGGPNDEVWKHVQSLSAIVEKQQVGEIHHSSTNNLPFGIGWNSHATLAGGCSCSKWAAQLPNMHLAATLEFPYANAGGTIVSPDSARIFGKALMKALVTYLQK